MLELNTQTRVEKFIKGIKAGMDNLLNNVGFVDNSVMCLFQCENTINITYQRH
jgi:hypothetical protein